MEKLAFVASLGALVPSVVLLQLSDLHFARVLAPPCNFVLDATLFPRPGAIHDHLVCMRSVGRIMYAEFYLFDMVLFPLIYVTSLVGVLRRLWPATPLLRLLPLGAGMADVAENVCMSYLLKEFPTRHVQVEIAVSRLTPAKWAFVSVAVTIVGIGIVWRGIHWATRGRQITPGSTSHDKAM